MVAVVAGSSMEPVLRSGDLVIGLTGRAFQCGDIVIFRNSTNGRLIVHRILAIEGDLVTTHGDNTDWGIREVVSRGDVLARIVMSVPGVGSGILKLKRGAGIVYD